MHTERNRRADRSLLHTVADLIELSEVVEPHSADLALAILPVHLRPATPTTTTVVTHGCTALAVPNNILD